MSYKKLRKKFTPGELADAFVFPMKFTAKQKKEEAELLANSCNPLAKIGRKTKTSWN